MRSSSFVWTEPARAASEVEPVALGVAIAVRPGNREDMHGIIVRAVPPTIGSAPTRHST
jgi:hypothetical protein